LLLLLNALKDIKLFQLLFYSSLKILNTEEPHGVLKDAVTPISPLLWQTAV